MKTIRHKAYFRQRVIKEIEKGHGITEIARIYRISRMSIYRWKVRYDGRVESLEDKSHRPHSHPTSKQRECNKFCVKSSSMKATVGRVSRDFVSYSKTMDSSLFIWSQSLILAVHFLVASRVARNRDLVSALSLGNIALPLVTLRYCRFRFSMIFVEYITFLTLSENLKNGDNTSQLSYHVFTPVGYI